MHPVKATTLAPAENRRRREARKARGRLYPTTVFYSAYCTAVAALALRSGRWGVALLFFALGAVAWTLMEYLIHRYILHGRFPDGPGLIRHFLHQKFDALHWEHHEHPWDAEHISGRIRDTLPFSSVFILLSLLTPLHTFPVMVAGLLQAYVAEEWVHHSVHFYRFRNPYFRYIKRHHLYHHSPRGEDRGYGLSSGVWDVVWGTRFPEAVRLRLHARKARRQGGTTSALMTPIRG